MSQSTDMKRLPSWIKSRLACGETGLSVHKALAQTLLNTVCESAHCPNRAECFGRGTVTVMILGDVCTRNCGFCAVRSGKPGPLERDEPRRVAELAARLNLKHVVITSVTRDDIPDGGASVFAETILMLKRIPGTTVEVLTPDFRGSDHSVARVLGALPDVFNHNLETVRRLQAHVRPRAGYKRSLKVLEQASEWKQGVRVKSGIMVGLGETDAELFEAMRDLLSAGCRYLTIGQYLSPSRNHEPVARYVHPRLFDEYRDKALGMGFNAVVSGPLVRSSYRAGELMREPEISVFRSE